MTKDGGLQDRPFLLRSLPNHFLTFYNEIPKKNEKLMMVEIVFLIGVIKMKNSNTKEVIAKVQTHMIRHLGGKKILYSELTNRSYGPTVYARVKKMVDGGFFLAYYSDIREFLHKIGYTKAQLEKMSNDKVWDLYKHLLARDGERFVRDYGRELEKRKAKR